MRETRNDLNRANNAETANIARTISASMKTINNIIKIMDTVGLEILPVELRQIANSVLPTQITLSSRSQIV